MKLLDNIPRRTYYNHVKKLQEQDRQIMEQWMSENVEQVSEELMIYRETLCQKLREVQGIIDNKNTTPKDKMQAIEQYLAISEKLVKFDKSGRLDAMKYAKYSPPSPY
jgi:GTPase involved in cell partitioning and DNA repair